MTVYRLGTRGSVLATTQSGHVADALAEWGLACELVVVRTTGDVNRASLSQMGGTGVFAAELREALLDGRCDLAVHSLKDLPTTQPEGLVIGAVPLRLDPSDVLCTADGAGLADLPAGARIGTGSPRRVAQILDIRPDLEMVDLRGNVDTRLGRVYGPGADLDGVVLARAGLERLGRLDPTPQYQGHHRVEVFDAAGAPRSAQVLGILPAPGQGALAVEMRADDDTDLAAALRWLDHAATRRAVTAERDVLAQLGVGCSAPIGAFAYDVLPDGGRQCWMQLEAVVATPGGLVRRRGRVDISPRLFGAYWGDLPSRLDPAIPPPDPVDVQSLGTCVADKLAAAMR